MKSLKIEAEFVGGMSIITFKDEDGKTLCDSNQCGELVSNTFAMADNAKAMEECAELLREAAEKIMGEERISKELKEVLHVANITNREGLNAGDTAHSSSLKFTVDGIEFMANDVDIHKIEPNGILTATMTLPITIG